MTRFAFSGILVMVLFSVALNSGCAKDKPCKATITVVDTNNLPISGAVVRLYVIPPTTSTVDLRLTTDGSGKATFEVNLPQILDIEIRIGSPATIYPTGKVARFEQGKTDEVTIKLP